MTQPLLFPPPTPPEREEDYWRRIYFERGGKYGISPDPGGRRFEDPMRHEKKYRSCSLRFPSVDTYGEYHPHLRRLMPYGCFHCLFDLYVFHASHRSGYDWWARVQSREKWRDR